MKVLMSISPKFHIVEPIELLNIIDQTACDGFEFAVDHENESHRIYLENFIDIMDKEKYSIQFHGKDCMKIEEYYQYLDYIASVTNQFDYSVKIVFHPKEKDTLEESNLETNLLFSKLLEYIEKNNLNIMISVENLRNHLNKQFLVPILSNIPELKFTYDIGHELGMYGDVTNLPDLLIARMDNVHLHSFSERQDHIKLYQKDPNKLKWIKSLIYLKAINYRNGIVLEYDLYDMYGDTLQDKIKYYAESCDYIKSYFI